MPRNPPHPATRTSYTDDEDEFLAVVRAYQVQYKRPFPSLVELLAIAKSLGWKKQSPQPEEDES